VEPKVSEEQILKNEKRALWTEIRSDSVNSSRVDQNDSEIGTLSLQNILTFHVDQCTWF
jgi:hypothetical protein